MAARIASSLIGCWLSLSVYFWPQPGVRGFTNLVLGLILAVTGFCGIWLRSLRYFDGLLGLWLLGSVLAFNYQPPWAGIHDAVIGALLVVLAAFSGREGYRNLDHWVEQFDNDPALLKRPFRSLAHA